MAGNVVERPVDIPQELIDNPNLLAEWIYKAALQINALGSPRESLILQTIVEPADDLVDANGIGVASIYIDVADDDLKVKFANNTVKVIATN